MQHAVRRRFYQDLRRRRFGGCLYRQLHLIGCITSQILKSETLTHGEVCGGWGCGGQVSLRCCGDEAEAVIRHALPAPHTNAVLPAACCLLPANVRVGQSNSRVEGRRRINFDQVYSHLTHPETGNPAVSASIGRVGCRAGGGASYQPV